MNAPLSIALPPDVLRREMAARSMRGEVVVSISSHGTDGTPLVSVLWGRGTSAQRLEVDIPGPRVASVLARHAREGFHAAHVAMRTSRDEARLAIVLEAAPHAHEGSPLLVGPAPFRGADGAFFLAAGPARDAWRYVRSVAAAGSARLGDGTDVLACAVLWPQPRTHVAWSVHLDVHDDAAGAWEARPEVRVLGGVARPVQLVRLGAGPTVTLLSLWHDTAVVPWPSDDPLVPRQRSTVVQVSLDVVTAAVGTRLAPPCSLHVDAGSGNATLLFDEPGTHADGGHQRVLERRRVVSTSACVDRSTSVTLDDPVDVADAPAAHPLDAWVFRHMASTGSRHAQLVAVSGKRTVHASAYTLAEEGYPVATLDQAMRLGSVSKVLTALAILALAAREGDARGLDRPALEATGISLSPGVAPRLATVTLRHLLAHDAGLGSFADLSPDDPSNPLAAARVARLAGRADGRARAGDLSLALAVDANDAMLVRPPGGAGAELGYSNEGYVWLGEIAGRLALGDPAGYERALAQLVWAPAGVDPGARGSLAAPNRTAAGLRRESPAHPSSPTWARAGSDVVLASYADEASFLGGAAGVSAPLGWIASVCKALIDPRGDAAPYRRAERNELFSPSAPRRGHGAFLGETTWWTHRRDGAPPVSTRVARIHHNGRVEGGSTLLLLQVPVDPGGDVDAGVAIAFAENQLGPLYAEPHGRELYAILRGM